MRFRFVRAFGAFALESFLQTCIEIMMWIPPKQVAGFGDVGTEMHAV